MAEHEDIRRRALQILIKDLRENPPSQSSDRQGPPEAEERTELSTLLPHQPEDSQHLTQRCPRS